MEHIKSNTLFQREKIQKWLLEATENSNVEEMFLFVSDKTDDDRESESIDPQQLLLARAVAKSFLILFKNFTKKGKEKELLEEMPKHMCMGCFTTWMAQYSSSALDWIAPDVSIFGGGIGLEIALMEALSRR